MMLFGEADTASHHFWMFADPRSPRFDAEGARRFGARSATCIAASMGRSVRDPGRGARPTRPSWWRPITGSAGRGTTVLHLNRWLAEHGWLDVSAWPPRARAAARAAASAGPRWRCCRPACRSGSSAAVDARSRTPSRKLVALRRDRHGAYAGVLGRAQLRAEHLVERPRSRSRRRGRPRRRVRCARGRASARRSSRGAIRRAVRPSSRRVHRRDEIYAGALVDTAPDLVLELALEDGYSFPCLPTTPAERRSVRRLAVARARGRKGRRHERQPPARRSLGARGAGRVAVRRRAEAAIVDVAPSVLHLAGLDVPAWMDGRLLPGIPGAARIADDAPAMTDEPTDQDHEAELRRRLHALGYLSEPAA